MVSVRFFLLPLRFLFSINFADLPACSPRTTKRRGTAATQLSHVKTTGLCGILQWRDRKTGVETHWSLTNKLADIVQLLLLKGGTQTVPILQIFKSFA